MKRRSSKKGKSVGRVAKRCVESSRNNCALCTDCRCSSHNCSLCEQTRRGKQTRRAEGKLSSTSCHDCSNLISHVPLGKGNMPAYTSRNWPIYTAKQPWKKTETRWQTCWSVDLATKEYPIAQSNPWTLSISLLYNPLPLHSASKVLVLWQHLLVSLPTLSCLLILLIWYLQILLSISSGLQRISRVVSIRQHFLVSLQFLPVCLPLLVWYLLILLIRISRVFVSRSRVFPLRQQLLLSHSAVSAGSEKRFKLLKAGGVLSRLSRRGIHKLNQVNISVSLGCNTL